MPRLRLRFVLLAILTLSLSAPRGALARRDGALHGRFPSHRTDETPPPLEGHHPKTSPKRHPAEVATALATFTSLTVPTPVFGTTTPPTPGNAIPWLSAPKTTPPSPTATTPKPALPQPLPTETRNTNHPNASTPPPPRRRVPGTPLHPPSRARPRLWIPLVARMFVEFGCGIGGLGCRT
jgi:hypothetical protein